MVHQEQINIEERSLRAKKLPWFLPTMCDGCASCVNACPKNILIMEVTEFTGVYIPKMGEYHLCIGCGKCTDTCAMGAVVMTSYLKEAVDKYDREQTVCTYQY